MTNRRSLNPVRLREIRRLAGMAEAEETTAPVTRVRNARVFGPLFYSTLVIAAICLLYLGALRVAERVDRDSIRANEVNPEKELGVALARLRSSAYQPRIEGARALGHLVRRCGPGDDWSALWDKAVSALQKTLSDRDRPMRAAAAAALGSLPQAAVAAQKELIAALKDDDVTVRLAAARALLMIGDDSKTPALRALADLVAGPTPLPEVLTSLDTMVRDRQGGERCGRRGVGTPAV